MTKPNDTAGEPAVSYSFRPSLMGSPQSFTVAADGLHWNIGRHAGRIPFDAIRRIRLAYRPVTLQTHRFQIEVWSSAAPKITIASTSWHSMVEQRRQDGPFRAFVQALHRRIAEAGQRPDLRSGSPPFVYYPGVAVFAGMAIVFPLMLVKTANAEALWGTALVALIIGAFLWQLGGFFWRNRPLAYQADAVPESVLPRA